MKIESKLKVCRFIGELVKFNMFPKSEALFCLKQLLFDFAHHHIEMACTLLDTCGRFCLRSPEVCLHFLQKLLILISRNFSVKSILLKFFVKMILVTSKNQDLFGANDAEKGSHDLGPALHHDDRQCVLFCQSTYHGGKITGKKFKDYNYYR